MGQQRGFERALAASAIPPIATEISRRSQCLPNNHGDSLFNRRVGHFALGSTIPRLVSFSGSAL